MSVGFNTIPGNVLVPLFYAEINSGGTPYVNFPRLLLVGQKTSAGTATAGMPIGPVQSEAEVIALAGAGSMLQTMYRIGRRNAPFQPIWLLPLADPAGAAAAGKISLAANPGVTGAGIVRIMGRRVVIQVNAADTKATVAAALVAAINAMGLPVTAAVNGTNTYECDLTARHVGTAGNTIDVKLVADEANALVPSNVTITAMAGGSGSPDLAPALANLGDDEYDWIAGPYVDTTSLDAVRDFLDGSSGRWSPTKQLYGHYVTANFGTLSANVTLGNGRNDPHVSIMASQASPTPAWEWAAALAAQACAHLGNAPELSRPLQTLVLDGVLPPDDRSKWWDIDDRQALYADGMSGYKVTVDGSVMIDRVTTTYQQTNAGAPDGTFRDVETMAQLMYVTRYFRSAILNRHARQALADDNPFNVSNVATPKSIKATLIHAYNDLVALGVAEKPDLFAEYVVVERDALDANRVNAALPIDVVNQLRVFAANITAFLQYRTPSGAVAV
ncbi:phage tail sheath subtilisin-like domain-containing protein [Xanthobacteraceae bacterium Astr-EGSB]|uniref:phage tail sheath subtilisin-like domain-containing protein n=1 Tax=Astrobacterium formosum TaxID=3069710 RepID=UPI0027B09095|nr:phage tail sheath subtilisin-like domain-containing protein [Xanthobacteraceae bacterium Astr-EGSB]